MFEERKLKNRVIFIVTPFENRMARRGTRLPQLADILTRKGYCVEYVTSNFSHAYKNHFTGKVVAFWKSRLKYKMTVLNVIGYRKNLSIRRILSNFHMAIVHFLYLIRVVKKGDVIVVPSRPVDLVFFVSALKLFRKITTILDIRDIWPDAYVTQNCLLYRLFATYCRFFLQNSIKRFDSFVQIAPSFAEWLHRYAPNAKSYLIPPGYESERWRSLRPRKQAKGETIRLVFVGVLQYQLDIMPFIMALRTRTRFSLTIIGDNGTGARYQTVMDYIIRNKMSNVYILGEKSPDCVVKLLKNHQIGIIPLISNTITNKMFDYIAAYMPIISLGENDTSDFVKEYDIGWTTVFDSERVGELLDSLTQREILRKSSNVTKIRRNFSRDVLYGRFVKIIERTYEQNPSI